MMPGAFPRETSQEPDINDGGNEISLDPSVFSNTFELVEQENKQEFENRQKVYMKTHRQLSLIEQLDTLVYILVGYQLIKYCHSACLLPVIGHVLVQKLLCCERFRHPPPSRDIRDFLSFINELDRSGLESGANVQDQINGVANKVCSAIYWKSVVSILYHIGFVSFWLIPLADKGNLSVLANGTWWFISFIGEPISVKDISADTGYFHKLADLGLFGLIVSDLCILFIQLTLYQAIYRQSNVSPIGRKLTEREVEMLRSNLGSTGNGSELSDSTFEPPVALVIRLFETFNSSTFIRQPE